MNRRNDVAHVPPGSTACRAEYEMKGLRVLVLPIPASFENRHSQSTEQEP